MGHWDSNKRHWASAGHWIGTGHWIGRGHWIGHWPSTGHWTSQWDSRAAELAMSCLWVLMISVLTHHSSGQSVNFYRGPETCWLWTVSATSSRFELNIFMIATRIGLVFQHLEAFLSSSYELNPSTIRRAVKMFGFANNCQYCPRFGRVTILPKYFWLLSFLEFC